VRGSLQRVSSYTPIEAKRVSEIDWQAWTPSDRATLLFVIRDGEILLIRKRRGLGAGKINGPGGKLEPGESARAAAIREVQEEVGVTPVGVSQRGELSFQFVDGYGIHVTVFSASDCTGKAVTTDEAVPLWTPVSQIPYHEMWVDDEIWLPWLLEGERFSGRFIFDGDAMLDCETELQTGDRQESAG
jgi:8-oxo-dGTP diphosphatase